MLNPILVNYRQHIDKLSTYCRKLSFLIFVCLSSIMYQYTIDKLLINCKKETTQQPREKPYLGVL